MDKPLVTVTVRLLTMRTKTALISFASASAALSLAGGAFAATPQQIYRDAADGKLNHHYSPADLRRAAHNATLSGYGNQVINIIIKNVNKQVFTPPTTHRPPMIPVRHVPTRGVLPFTGSDLATFTSLGIALMAGGFLLRLIGRKPLGNV
jgi:hypothetical protein